LAQFNVTPTLDFDLDPSIQQLSSIQQPFTEQKKEAIASTSIFKGFTQKHQAHFIEPSEKNQLKHWKEFYEDESGKLKVENEDKAKETLLTHDSRLTFYDDAPITQLFNAYIVLPSANSFLLIHQQAAHERVLYEQLSAAARGKPVATQQSMFPVTFELTPADAVVLQELMDDLNLLGYTIEPFGKNTFVIQGTPADLEPGNEKQIIDLMLEQYKHFSGDLKFSKREKLVRSLAKQQSIKTGVRLTEKEMRQLVNDLFSCEHFNSIPDGTPTYLEFKQEALNKMFGK
jgi:DNA mismatch repair protein MutL